MAPAKHQQQDQGSFVATKPKRALSNLAAEYVEVTAGHDIGSRTAPEPDNLNDGQRNGEGSSRVQEGERPTVRIPEFVADLDCFVSPEEDRA